MCIDMQKQQRKQSIGPKMDLRLQYIRDDMTWVLPQNRAIRAWAFISVDGHMLWAQGLVV